jgi:hypothetical protein
MDNYAFEWVPSINSLVLIWGQEVYFVDRATGKSEYRGDLSGLDIYDGIAAFFVRPNGSIVGFGFWTALQSGIAIYDMDLNSLSASHYAYMTAPGASRVTDVAMRSNGELWASVGNSMNSNLSGYYEVNVAAATMVLRVAYPAVARGISFGPSTTSSTYCTAKTTSNGCAPSISSAGNASLTAGSGFFVSCTGARNQSSGLLIFGVGGANAVPFGGGTLCVAPPRARGPISDSGGTPAPAVDCSGAWSIDFNSWASTNWFLPAGTTVNAQWIGRDSGYAPPQNFQLSNAVEFTLIP